MSRIFRSKRETMPIPGVEYVSTLTHSERQIIAMLEDAVDPLTVCRAIRSGSHLVWRPKRI